ncbi:hypothetical protein J4732_16160 [Serratia marcescens]|uniref:Uncharacterized protein n=1 Tax=Serratia marcescens TaxID=615 RepID=A0A939NLD9_SERMA|nr:hypothetical protein [Serratia marcescens]
MPTGPVRFPLGGYAAAHNGNVFFLGGRFGVGGKPASLACPTPRRR